MIQLLLGCKLHKTGCSHEAEASSKAAWHDWGSTCSMRADMRAYEISAVTEATDRSTKKAIRSGQRTTRRKCPPTQPSTRNVASKLCIASYLGASSVRIQSNSVSTTAVGSSTKAESLGLSAKARPRSGRCPWPSRTRPGRPCLGERKELGPGFRLWSQRTSEGGAVTRLQA